MATAPVAFQRRIDAALASPTLETALARALPALRGRRVASMAGADFPALKADLERRKRNAIARLPELIEQFTASATRNGASVHYARTPAEACEIVGRLCRERHARLVVKGKSMVSEEIGLNPFLEGQGVKVVETDLGEWIIQLAGEHPTHLLAPALHKTREQIAELLHQATGEPADPNDIEALVKIARRALRQSFIDADIGITGANFALADSGTIGIVTNEGNDRLAATLPPTHIAILGIEKIVADLDDATAILKVLSRSATGQQQSVYVSYITGPSRTADIELSLTIGVHGPQEVHLVLLDNGRLAMRDDPEFREALHCIRCAACANVCPAYQAVGGAVFGHIYTGPIGLMLTAFHHGLEHAAGPQSLCVSCNACETVCPVGIPLARQILTLRQRVVDRQGLPRVKAAVLRRVAQPGELDRWTRTMARLQRPFARGRFVERLPGQDRLVRWRSLPALAERPLRDRVLNLPTPSRAAAGPLAASGAAGARIAYFAGCMTDRLYPEMGEAVIKVLRACGAHVTFPAAQSCCGLPALNSGDRAGGLAMARQTIAALEGLDVDYLLSASASCVVTLVQDYPHLFRDDAAWAARAAALATKVIDFTTFMDRVARLPAGALAATDPAAPAITYHDACQSHNCLGLKAEPRRLLTEVLGLTLTEMQEPSFCCGFGGSFSIEHGDVAERIVGRKLRDIDSTGAAIVVADNPGCLLHLRGVVNARRLPLRVLHLAEVVAARLNDLERAQSSH
ncbi:MAG: LUD domain-containing protein [Chloroflexi bacterium]|nr:LUD domain-containing protein [Chloroflexota bacterium]